MKPSISRIRRGLRDFAPAIYRERSSLHDLRLLALGANIAPQRVPIPAADAPGWRAIAPGDRWGGQDQNIWLHGETRVPAAWRKRLGSARYTLALRLLLGESPDFGWPEGLLYVNGTLLQGINQHHPDVLIPNSMLTASLLRFDVRAWSGMKSLDHQLEYAEVALLDRDLESLYYLLSAGLDLVEALDEREPVQQPLYAALEDTYDALDLHRPETPALEDSGARALAALRARLARLRAEYDPPQRPRITAIGHGHLDVAWLWQTRHTREKTARTFSIAAALMDLYPEYHFLHTTPQVYDWLARDYPDLFARVRERVAGGRFEAAGAMWLESDTNLVSGESLVRQIMYGQRYLRETFGAEYDLLWLPDTFGYTYALPQIMLKSGLRAFMTTKMSWSDTNRLQHDTFRWRGLDGSETLAHFVTTPWLSYNPHDTWETQSDTYNGRLDVAATRKLWDRYRSKEVNRDLLLIYGYGDGGAGPTRQFIQNYRALIELPGMPDLRLGRADDYFHALRARVWNNPELPVWDGELYLEYHRGVYTTHGWLKRLHRRNEERLLHAEALDAQRWALAYASDAEALDARATLDDAWRMLLLHEFHDILPGSSIAPVYVDARRELSALAVHLDAFIEQTMLDIGRLTGVAPTAWLIHNPSPVETPHGLALVTLPLSEAPATARTTGEGYALTTQPIETLSGERALLLEAPYMPARGWLALYPITELLPASASSAPPTASRTPEGSAVLESAAIRVTIAPDGSVTSIFDPRDIRGRELVSTGARANEFIAFDDRPKDFDAWDIDAGHERKRYQMESAEIVSVESGPLRASARVKRRLLGSQIIQDIAIYHDGPRIDFITHIDWHEHHLLLKVAFPLDLRVTQARSEIQYGSITRPTHRNTSWDEARFETVAHRWVDLSESGYGVALLNDSKYGYDIHGSTIRLSLLRSPTVPDPDTDQGPHDIVYSLLPHEGAWPAGDVIANAYTLNRPPLVIPPQAEGEGGHGQPAHPLFTMDTVGPIIEAVKRAANGDDVIVRVYEAHGARHLAHITCSLPLASVVETDLLERPLREGESPAFDLWQASAAASHDAPILDRERWRDPRAQTDKFEDQAQLDDYGMPAGWRPGRGWMFALRPFEVRTFRVTLAQP